MHGKGAEPIGCRCRWMSGRRSPTTCAAAGPGSRAGHCSCRHAPRCRAADAPPGGVRPAQRLRRAGLPEVGAHRLRHTAAADAPAGRLAVRDRPTAAPRRGTSHRIYARDDRGRAREAARLAGSRGMTDLHAAAGEYLAIRRALGFKLVATTGCSPSSSPSSPTRPPTLTVQHGGGLGHAHRPGATPAQIGVAAVRRPRVRPLPARPRPGHRGAAGADLLLAPPGDADPVPVHRRRGRRVAGRGDLLRPPLRADQRATP